MPRTFQTILVYAICAYSGVHTVVCIQWCAYSGVHTVVCIQWCAYTGVHTVVCIQWCAYSGVHTVVCIQWWAYICVHTGVCIHWCAYSGVHTVVCIQWCIHWCAYTGVLRFGLRWASSAVSVILRQIEPGTETKWRTVIAVYDTSDTTSVERTNNSSSKISDYFRTIISTTIQTAGGKKAEQSGNKNLR